MFCLQLRSKAKGHDPRRQKSSLGARPFPRVPDGRDVTGSKSATNLLLAESYSLTSFEPIIESTVPMALPHRLPMSSTVPP